MSNCNNVGHEDMATRNQNWNFFTASLCVWRLSAAPAETGKKNAVDGRQGNVELGMVKGKAAEFL